MIGLQEKLITELGNAIVGLLGNQMLFDGLV